MNDIPCYLRKERYIFYALSLVKKNGNANRTIRIITNLRNAQNPLIIAKTNSRIETTKAHTAHNISQKIKNIPGIRLQIVSIG